MTPQEYVEEVLSLVEHIPAGRVMSYGAIADHLAERSGRNSARAVGTIMARYGAAVPWHRVVASSGRLPPGHEVEAKRLLLADDTPLRGDTVDMSVAAWRPVAAQWPQSSRPTPPRRGSPAAPPRPTAVTPPK